jgi:hypothetical protein
LFFGQNNVHGKIGLIEKAFEGNTLFELGVGKMKRELNDISPSFNHFLICGL